MSSGRVRLAALMALTLCVSPLARAQSDLNVIKEVRVRSDGAGMMVEVIGSKPPNFTTFTMSDPARLVVDISEAVFAGVPAEQQIGNGVVTSIKTASYGSEQSAIARVLIGFVEEPETELATSDTTLVVRLAGEESAVAGSELPQADGNLAVADAQGPDGQAAVQLTAEQKAKEEAERRAAEEKRVAEQKAREEAERRAAEEKRVAEQKAREEAERRVVEERRIAEQQAKEEAERRAAEEKRIAEQKAAERRAAEEKRIAEQKAKEAAERRVAEERRIAEQKAKETAERRAAEERRIAEQKAKEEAERRAAEERRIAEQKAKEEAERRAAEERRIAEQKAKEERQLAERQAREAERRAAEEKQLAERRAREEAERLRLEEQRRVAEEKRAAELRAREEAARRRLEEQQLAEQRARQEAENKRLERERKIAERAAREEAERNRINEEREQQLAAQRERDEAERARLEERRLAQQRARQEAAMPRVTSGEPPVTRHHEGSGRSGSLEKVGFKLLPDVARVFVRVTEGVSYSVGEAGPNLVVVELQGADIGSNNNRRHLDTSFFNTAVSRISPKAFEGGVRIEISLADQAPYRVHQEGADIFVDFSR